MIMFKRSLHFVQLKKQGCKMYRLLII